MKAHSPSILQRNSTSGRASGFSLVETAIATAIAALGIISILGLMPQGLEMARKTGSLFAETRIMQDVVGELEASDWTQLSTIVGSGNGAIRQYDDQGVRLPAGGDSFRAAFVAKIELSSTGTILPGATQAEPNEYLRGMVLKIGTSPNPNFDFSSKNRRRFSTTNFLLAKRQ